MPYEVEYRENVVPKLQKLDKYELSIINKKIEQILLDPYRYKPLSNIMKGFLRTHVLKSYVLVFSVDEEKSKVIIEDFDHHDKIYR